MADDQETEEDLQHARDRIHGETVEGCKITYPDGTRVVNGVVVNIGPRAIMDGDRLLGMRPAVV